MKPFVYKFETPKNKYIYDVNTNKVFQVGDTAFELIDDYSIYNFDEIMQKYSHYTSKQLLDGLNEIDDAVRKYNVFSSHRPSKMIYWDDLYTKNVFEYASDQQLILNVTESCNLRCSYCVYSGKYKGRRVHSKHRMSFETSKIALDKFMQNAKDIVYISFYGGEPLLNFSLIKNIVEYTVTFYKRNINWTMTTNGILLSKPICDFLYKYDFTITISLDGPKEIHDKNRKQINGEGSYDIVVANLLYLKALDEDFYNNKILFSIVSVPPSDLALINDFFSSEPLVCKNKILFSYMNDGIDGFENAPASEDYDTANNMASMLFNQIVNKAINSNLKGSLIEDLCTKDFVRFYHRSKTLLTDSLYPNRCCLPGSSKIFVSTDQKLYMCEKVDNCYEIGTIEKWIDKSLIKKIFDEYIRLSADCFDCWACRLCPNCFASFIFNSKFDRNTRKRKCERTRSSLAVMLVNYYSILEENLSAFDYMKDIEHL